ncbi:protein kinase [Actinosynnema sp. NPDC047251]|uniref:non-specific serine/threonine protein kinase n=1 Tax=Saccharothrix espanaensis (strain ATCC 51144 / DSM 44229 / JCM 9112 / NBRC 15066 / NRRL 15764) TaxID=1179773 RepID=K0JYL6_SACES|nr:serine/threonine-protein kinase [Saccharothrix espanaensis]CCH33025.1 hypothetical protein BN6_57670 [Saccharothrix espanaensis DSM 44229]
MSRSLDAELLAGRYRLLEPIGDGGLVRTHHGWDALLRRDVTVKVFAPTADPEAGRVFDREVGALARLSHPGLLSVYDTDVHRGARFVVLRHVEGRTLRELVDGQPLEVGRVCRIGEELADALDHVHSHGLVHGEVRASHVLVDDEGSACLSDFGLEHPIRAVSRENTEDCARPEAKGDAGGATALRAAVGATDVHDLGLVLLECLTGRVVEDGQQSAEVPVNLPDKLKDLLSRMTSPVADERPPARACAYVLGAVAPDVEVPEPEVQTAVVAGPTEVVAVSGNLDVSDKGTPERPASKTSWKVLAASAGVLVGALAITAATTSVLSPAPSTPEGTSTSTDAPQVPGATPQDEARPQLVGSTRSSEAARPTSPAATAAKQDAQQDAQPATQPAPGPGTEPVPTTTPTTTTVAPTTTSVAPTSETSESSPAPTTSVPPDEVGD